MAVSLLRLRLQRHHHARGHRLTAGPLSAEQTIPGDNASGRRRRFFSRRARSIRAAGTVTIGIGRSAIAAAAYMTGVT